MLENCIRDAQLAGAWLAAGALIERAHRERRWELLGYANWASYVRREFGISPGYASKLRRIGRTGVEGRTVVEAYQAARAA